MIFSVKHIFIILLSLFSLQTQGQDSNYVRKTVLIVPFSPYLYINDANTDIINETKLSYNQLLNVFRFGTDSMLCAKINEKHYAVSLLNSLTAESNLDLEKIYGMSNYFFSKVSDFDKNSSGGYLHSKLEIKKKTEKKPDNNSAVQNGEVTSYVTNDEDKYLCAGFSEPRLLGEISDKYKADIILYLTQFEIKNDYSNPYAVGSSTYQRTVKIHYAVFARNCKLVFGSFSIAETTASMNLPSEIIRNILPVAINRIVSNLPL